MKNAKKKQCLKFFALFFKIADWKVLKIAPNVVLDQPVNLAHSDWMHHFAEGQSENSYGVRSHWGERGGPTSGCSKGGCVYSQAQIWTNILQTTSQMEAL